MVYNQETYSRYWNKKELQDTDCFGDCRIKEKHELTINERACNTVKMCSTLIVFTIYSHGKNIVNIYEFAKYLWA
jgi:hypothetical protein